MMNRRTWLPVVALALSLYVSPARAQDCVEATPALTAFIAGVQKTISDTTRLLIELTQIPPNPLAAISTLNTVLADFAFILARASELPLDQLPGNIAAIVNIIQQFFPFLTSLPLAILMGNTGEAVQQLSQLLAQLQQLLAAIPPFCESA